MEQKEENGDGNVEAAATRMQADAAIGAGSEPKARHISRHDRRTRRPRGNRKDNRKLSIEFPDQRKRNFCRLGRLKARPEQSPPHCCRDAHRPRWRYSTTRAPEGSTRATAWQPAQRSWSKRATARMPLSATQHASAHPFSSTSS
jgi:hypothetical protein